MIKLNYKNILSKSFEKYKINQIDQITIKKEKEKRNANIHKNINLKKKLLHS